MHFPEDESLYAYEFRKHLPTTPVLLARDAGEDRVISPRRRPHLSESEGSEIQNPNHNDASILEDVYEFGEQFTSTPDSSEFYADEDRAISREWTPLPESEDSEIQIPIHDDASTLEDAKEFGQQFTSTPDSSEFYAAEGRARSREWTPLPESEDSEIQIPIHDDASTLEDANEFGQQFTSTPDSSEFYAAEGGARSREWTPLPESEDSEIQIPIHDDALTLEDANEFGQQFTSPPDSSEFYAAEGGARSREWSLSPECEDSEIQTPTDDGASILEDACEVGQVFSSSSDASAFWREWTSVPEFEDSEIQTPIHDDASTMEDAHEFGQEFTSTPDSSEFHAAEDGTISREVSLLPESEDGEIQTPIHDGASMLEDDLPCGKPQQWIEYSESGDVEHCVTPQESASEEGDESLEGDSPEPRRLFPVNQPAFCNPPQTGLQTTTFCPAPLRRFLTPEGIKQFDAFEDWYVRTNGGVYPDAENEKYTSIASSPGPGNNIFSLGEISPFPENEFDERDESLEGDSPEPRRLFPVNQPAFSKPPQTGLQTTTFCPAPLRRFLTPEGIKQFDAFEDWYVRTNGGVYPDAENEKYTSIASSPGPGNKIFSLGEISPFPENEFGERDDISEADSPGPRQLFPVNQSHPAEYDPPQLAPQMGIHCPIPIRKHATHEVILRPELFDDWFVDMRELVFIDEAISPDKSVG